MMFLAAATSSGLHSVKSGYLVQPGRERGGQKISERNQPHPQYKRKTNPAMLAQTTLANVDCRGRHVPALVLVTARFLIGRMFFARHFAEGLDGCHPVAKCLGKSNQHTLAIVSACVGALMFTQRRIAYLTRFISGERAAFAEYPFKLSYSAFSEAVIVDTAFLRLP